MSANRRNVTATATFTVGTSGVIWRAGVVLVPFECWRAANCRLLFLAGYERVIRVVNPVTGGAATFVPRSAGGAVWRCVEQPGASLRIVPMNRVEEAAWAAWAAAEVEMAAEAA